MVKRKYRSALVIGCGGIVTVDFGIYASETRFYRKNGSFKEKKFNRIVARGMRDSGIALTSRLVNAKNDQGQNERYLYTADFKISGRSRENPDQVVTDYYEPGTVLTDFDSQKYPQYATSNTPHGTETHCDLPLQYDGEVNLVPGEGFLKLPDGSIRHVPRNEIVRHELSEIYIRTHEKKGFDYAHQEAGGLELDFFKIDK